MNGTVLTRGSHEWATRPDDQRYLDLESLLTAVQQRKKESWTSTTPAQKLRCVTTDDGDLAVATYNRTVGDTVALLPSNWAFGQLASYAKAPAQYLRSLPAELAAINLQWGLESNPVRDNALVLAQSNGVQALRAMTSPSYGRIWDEQVVNSVMRVNTDGRWKVPSASYATSNPKRATTLYASDRDVFLFLVDDQNAIEVGGETLFRGFMAWNSEVGSAVFGLTTFLYRYVCDNRMVWGATNVQELRIRHTSGAPDRFLYEGRDYLRRYAEESSIATVRAIEKAQAYEIPDAAKPKGEGKRAVGDWLKARGFTAPVAKAAVDAAEVEEGEVRSLWDVINGVTAYARGIKHTDARVDLETKAGRLMDLVAK
jgi:hypothetical protein